MEASVREKKIFKVTVAGSIINSLLIILKIIAGIWGYSAAMIADAVHSLSDFVTDVIVIIFVHLSTKPKDRDHDYGHGKYETFATFVIGVALFVVGLLIFYNGLVKVLQIMNGESVKSPGLIAFIVAIASILSKEWAYRFTVKVGREVNSQSVIANAWHHRSDAFSSIGTAVGVGGAILLGHKWVILDPIAAMVVSIFIIKTALTLLGQSWGELMEASLSDEMEDELVKLAEVEPEVSDIHNVRTRKIGNSLAVEMHIRMPGSMTLYESHSHCTNIERRIKNRFGVETHVGLHVEPVKIDGVYKDPSNELNEVNK